MLNRLLVALLLFAAAMPAGVAEERIQKLAFSVGPHATLKFDTYRGSIDVQEATDGQVHIEASIDTGSIDEAKSEKMVEKLALTAGQVGNTVTIVQRNPKETGLRFVWGNTVNVTLAYTLLVPKGCNLDITTNDGGVSVGEMKSKVTVRTKKGAIFLRGVEGDIHAEAEGADIIVSHCSGTAYMKAFVGNVHAGTLSGHAEIRSTNGDIEVQHSQGGLNAIAELGDVTVGFLAGYNGDSTIKTNGGAITIRIDPAAHTSIQASSVWGKVRTSLPIAVESGGNEKRSLAGRLNGGGSRMIIHADGGHIRIDPPRI